MDLPNHHHSASSEPSYLLPTLPIQLPMHNTYLSGLTIISSFKINDDCSRLPTVNLIN